MEEFETNFSQLNKIDSYRILNSIKPLYFQTKFPYDKITPSKIVFTKRKIEIMSKEYEKFKKSKKKVHKNTETEYVGGYNNKIVIYN